MKAAVVLSGCGYLDGSEIQESVLALLALNDADIKYDCFSIDKNQTKVVNHTNHNDMSEIRNTLIESARIARGDISIIQDLKVEDFDMLVLPGGYGTAMNLSNIGIEDQKSVDEDVQECIKAFYGRKPIGAICFSPAIVACSLKNSKCILTLGSKENSKLITDFGCQYQACLVEECVCDNDNKIVSTPAYMYGNATIQQVHYGINTMMRKLLDLV